MENFSYRKGLNILGCNYLGSYSQSAKLIKSYNHDFLTYGIYLAPANLSGYNVCPNSRHCRENCLNGSGHNKGDILSKKNIINNARIRKAKLFFEDKETFMQLVLHEIAKYKNFAEKHGKKFAVRLNCTSDIDIKDFTYKGKNILEICPNIQFYDYTKVRKYIKENNNFDNYDLTLSYSGYNWNTCKEYLENNGRIAVVFYGKMPKKYKGYRVVCGDSYDMRFLDEKSVIIGLTYHKTANDYKNGKFEQPNNKFIVVTQNNKDCEF